MTAENPEYTRSLTVPAGTREVEARLELSTLPEEHAKAAVLFFSFRDRDGRELELTSGALSSQNFGYFVYLSARQSERILAHRIAVPEGAETVLAGVADWGVRLGDSKDLLDLIPRRDPVETRFGEPGAPSGVEINQLFLTYPVIGDVAVEINWKYRINPGAQGLLILEFFDARGEALLSPSSLATNPELGSYAYLATGPDEVARNSIVLQTPARAVTMRIRGARWRGDGAYLIERPELVVRGAGDVSSSDLAREWVASLEPDDDLLIIHTTAGAIRADNTLLLRSNRTAISLSERGWKVIFVPFSGLADANVNWVISPSLLQIPPESLGGVVSQVLSRSTIGRKVYVCSSRTDVSAISLQNRLQDHGWKTVYEIRDDMEEFQRVGYSKWYRPALEERFAREADGVIATSPRLAERIAVIAQRDDVELIPNAAPDSFIDATSVMRSVDHFKAVRSRPIVGYLGHLTESWFDWRAVLDMMRQLPDVSFEFIGHGMPDSVHLPMNAEYFGPMAHDEALPIMRHWRVGMIPFVESRLTFGVDPNKLYEYVALGVQTVSSPMGQVERAPGSHIFRTVGEFVELVATTVGIVPTDDYFRECDEFLSEASWSARTRQIDDYVKRVGR